MISWVLISPRPVRHGPLPFLSWLYLRLCLRQHENGRPFTNGEAESALHYFIRTPSDAISLGTTRRKKMTQTLLLSEESEFCHIQTQLKVCSYAPVVLSFTSILNLTSLIPFLDCS